MQFDLAGGLWLAFLFACALAAAALLIIAARHRAKWLPPLEELVKLDSRGWYLVASVASAGAVIMILTSQIFSTAYWVGLAIDSDGRKIPENLFPLGWWDLVTVTTITAFALSVVFELVADIGAPMASGLKREKRKGTPEFLLIVTAAAIVMSAASKWGYYEDRRQVRAQEAAQIAAADTTAQADLEDAIATIKRLEATPALATIQAAETSIARQIEDATKARDDARAAQAALPESHSTNRLKFQETINTETQKISDLEERLILAQSQRDDLAKLEDAKKKKAAAEAALERDAGRLTKDKSEIVKIGDTILLRLIRSALHQALCFLFPIIALDAWTAHREVKKREEAAARGAQTRKRNNPNAVYDADFSEPEPGDFGAPEIKALPPAKPATGEAPAAPEDPAPGDNDDTGGAAPEPESDEGADHDDDTDRRDDLEPGGA